MASAITYPFQCHQTDRSLKFLLVPSKRDNLLKARLILKKKIFRGKEDRLKENCLWCWFGKISTHCQNFNSGNKSFEVRQISAPCQSFPEWLLVSPALTSRWTQMPMPPPCCCHLFLFLFFHHFLFFPLAVLHRKMLIISWRGNPLLCVRLCLSTVTCWCLKKCLLIWFVTE